MAFGRLLHVLLCKVLQQVKVSLLFLHVFSCASLAFS